MKNEEVIPYLALSGNGRPNFVKSVLNISLKRIKYLKLSFCINLMHNWAQMKDILTLQDEFCHFRQNSGGHFEKAVFPGFAPEDF